MRMRSRRGARPQQKGSHATTIAGIAAVAIIGAIAYMVVMPTQRSQAPLNPGSTPRKLSAATTGRAEAPVERAPAQPRPAPVAAEMRQGSTDIPVWIELDEPQLVTVVIEDTAGRRVRNLAAAMRLPAGKTQLIWDGYDDGERQDDGSIIRHLVPPGHYRARGVTSDGLKLIYEFPVNSPGDPPWFTKKRNGAWLADHTAAQSIVMVPASDQGFLARGQSRLIASSITAECGDAFIALDLDGKKIIGNNDFGWTGAYAISLDQGPQRPTGDSDPWLYCLIPEGNTLKLNAFTTGGKALNVLTHKTRNEVTWNGGHTGDSVTAWNGTAVLSVPHDGELLVVDAYGKKGLIGTIEMPDARGVLFDDQGQLLVASATQIKRFTIDLEKAAVTGEEVLISTDLEDAQQLTYDQAGNLYVGDWGKQHVIKVFSPSGKLVRTIGKPGGPQLGDFDVERLHYPKGMAVDGRGQLWVADADHLPKRITSWSIADGTLTRRLIGGPKYGGGGALDPADRTRMYYGIFNGGYSMTLDWKAGTYAVDSVYSRPETDAMINPDNVPGSVAADCLHVGGNTYLVNNFQPLGGRGNPNECTIWLVGKDKVARPVAAIGGLYLMEESHGSWKPLNNPGIKERFSKLKMEDLLIWSDLNLDAKASPDEITTWRLDDPYIQAVRMQPDMSFIARNIIMPAPRIMPNGVPVWPADLKPEVVTGKLLPDNAVLVGKNEVFAFANGLVGTRDGQITWRYPTEGDRIPTDPGMIIQATRFLGPPFRAQKGEAGMVVGLNGEKGSLYLMTGDGLFLQDLGGDNRIAPHMGTVFPTAKRGMVVEGISFHDEHFCPSLSQTAEGDVVMIAGKEYSAIYRVDGLASVKRRTFATIDIDAARLASPPKTKTVVPRKQERLSLPVAVGGSAPQVDGKLDPKEWPGDQTAWATLDERASATVRIVGDRLYAAWRTGDPAALANAPGEPKLVFKRGGAVDLMIGSDPRADANRREPAAGDLRLIATLQDGKPLAVIYRAVAPNTAPGDRVPFISPVGRVDFDRVEIVTGQVQLAQRDGDIELSVPLALLGVQSVSEGTALLGDIGLLRGTGAMTTQRLYWNNIETSICSDVPSEARLVPANWGKWNIVPLGKSTDSR